MVVRNDQPEATIATRQQSAFCISGPSPPQPLGSVQAPGRPGGARPTPGPRPSYRFCNGLGRLLNAAGSVSHVPACRSRAAGPGAAVIPRMSRSHTSSE